MEMAAILKLATEGGSKLEPDLHNIRMEKSVKSEER